jgi:hypothetical protein
MTGLGVAKAVLLTNEREVRDRNGARSHRASIELGLRRRQHCVRKRFEQAERTGDPTDRVNRLRAVLPSRAWRVRSNVTDKSA